MLWQGLRCLTNSIQPIHVVISDSMAPTFQRGDVIFISNRSEVYVGDIPVVWFKGQPLPMVHRAVKVAWETKEGDEEREGGIE